MNIFEEEIHDVKKFISQLNSQKNGVVIVEGKRDSSALKKVGFTGKILEFHKFKGLIRFADAASQYERLIILLDGDKKGRFLTAKIIEQIQHRTTIDLSYKKKLISITKGKIRFIEELGCYEPFLR